MFKKRIIKPYHHSFILKKLGLVAIFVSARCKSRKQIKSNVDEDLRVEINGLQFREIPPEKYKQLFNIPSTFNGSKLKGLKKTVVFLIVLTKGEHTINLIPQKSAFVEDVKIQELGSEQEVALNIEKQAEDGDRRPWYSFVLVNLPLKIFSADVTVRWHWRDSDDVKLIIDNGIKKNNLSVLHKNWLWSANIFKKLLRKERQKKTFEENLAKGIHYLEFWADRTAVLHEVVLDIGKIEIPQGEKAKVVWESARLREGPKIELNNILIEEIKRGEGLVILEKAIQGNRPKNTKGEYLFSNRWHKARYKKQEGYIYSGALEVDGESKEEVQKIIMEKSGELDEDAALMLAIAEQESIFQPYRVSYGIDNPEKEIAFGVMQITTGAIKQVEDDYQYKVTNKFDIEQNIKCGIRYFQYLRTLYNKKESDYLRKLLASWNWGPTKMKKYKGKKLDFSNLPDDVQTFIKNVEIFYTRNQQENKNNGFIKILLIISLAAALLFPVVLGRFFLTKDTNQVPKILGSSYQINTNDADDIEIFQLEDDLDNDEKLEKIDFKSYFSEPDRLRNTEVELNNNKVLHLDGWFWKAYTKDIDKDNVKELIIALAVGVNGIWTEVYTFKDGHLNNIAVIDENDSDFSGFLGRGIKFIDYDNDGDLEVESFWRIREMCDSRSDTYEYTRESFIFKKAIVPTREEKLDCQDAMKEFKG